LDCGYDINNEHCIDCARRRVENEWIIKNN
jgi:hypothetical protein